jgi:hypothetical protein
LACWGEAKDPGKAKERQRRTRAFQATRRGEFDLQFRLKAAQNNESEKSSG